MQPPHTRPDPRPQPRDRAPSLLARLRHKQLDHARHGRFPASARYADRATRVRTLLCVA
jgi:hypothetical protein